MANISSDMYTRLRKVLLECGPFDDGRQLKSVFAHPRLSPWRHSLPQAPSPAARVDAIIAFLLDKHRSDTKENALVLLLRVLGERTDSGDACHNRLMELADALEKNEGVQESPDQTINVSHPEEIASLKRQLAKLKRNLLKIEERMADHIDPRNVPPDLAESERLTRERIAEVKARLANLQG